MKSCVALVAAFGLLTLALMGCSKDATSVGSRHTKAFQSADAQTKALWDTAMAAAKTNGFALAIVTLKSLQVQPALTPEQLKAVNETATAVSDQMYKAANRNDPAALQAIEELRKLPRR
jgi:hypothetical protein